MEKKPLGKFIAELRKEKGMTQKTLGNILGTSDKTISHWEREESSPDISLLPLIADTFGITVDELLKGEKNQFSPYYQTIAKSKGKTLAEKHPLFKVISKISLIISFYPLIFLAYMCISKHLNMTAANIATLLTVLRHSVFPVIATLVARFYLSRNFYPEKESKKENQGIILNANKITFFIIYLFSVSLITAMVTIIAYATIIKFDAIDSYMHCFAFALSALWGCLLPAILKHYKVLPKKKTDSSVTEEEKTNKQ